jgi:tetratricopeptide (TPR) repeat protein
MLRHIAFFEELGKMEETDPAWPQVSAGLVVMRLVDHWIADGVGANAWGMTAVREAIDQISAATPLRRILISIVDTIGESPTVDVRALNPRLMAYGQALEYDAKWSLATDVYETIIGHAHPVEDADLVATAYIQLATSLRNVGELGAASDAYEKAQDVANAAGDMIGVLRARIGEAKIAIARGNMPQAETILDDTIDRAEGEAFADVRSRALHDRATVAGLRGQFDRAIQFAYSALHLATSQRERDRILADIATGFLSLGLLDVARDAYLVLVATAQDQYVRWTAALNLMEIAGRQGAEPVFDRYRRELASEDLPPYLRVQYLLIVGNGYRDLGRADDAVSHLTRAVALASANQLNQLLFEAEESLAGARESVARP